MGRLTYYLMGNYEISLVLVCFIAYMAARRYLKAYEPLSIASLAALLYNYLLLERLFIAFDCLGISRGDSELMGVLGPFASLILAIVALLRIRKNKKKGKLIAWIPLVISGLCVLGGIILFILLCFGPSWH